MTGIVMRTRSRCRIAGFSECEYMIVTHPFEMGRVISKEEAKAFIRENGLVLAYSDENGKIYDTPDKEFLNQFRGYGSDRAKAARISEVFDAE